MDVDDASVETIDLQDDFHPHRMWVNWHGQPYHSQYAEMVRRYELKLRIRRPQ